MSTGETPGPGLSPETGPVVSRGRVGYGIDEPRTIAELMIAGVLSVGVGLLISAYTAESEPTLAETGLLVGPGVGFLILVVAAALYWSSRLGKFREMTKIVNNIPWGGGEVVLDLGCGRGMATILAAKRLRNGYVVGVDTWSKARISGNDPRSLMANAEAENAEPRVGALRASSAQLPFSDSSFDIILSGVAVHHLVRKGQREALFAELARVLKEGGRVGILDAGNGNEYSRLMNRTGLRDIEMHRLRFSSFPPFHVVLARKPFME